MNKAYVSEFETFMNRFLQAHPEVVAEQRRGWRSFWEVKIDRKTAHVSKEDIVPDDQYGFRWHAKKQP